MNTEQMHKMRVDQGFIAALDQSGGSTPKALAQYGVGEDRYATEAEMFDLVHAMRTRVITSPSFTAQHILGVILFENTMMRDIEGMPTPEYLWNRKGIVPFLKVDDGLAETANGVQTMKPMPDLDRLLGEAAEKRVFGTKMRSVIHSAQPDGVAAVVKQQFDTALKILAAGLTPIIEPEVDIHSPDKQEAEELLKQELKNQLCILRRSQKVMFKLSIPSQDGFYSDLMDDPRVVRVVALSGGYSRTEANERLSRNPGLIASFSRALLEGLRAGQTAEEFDQTLGQSIREIYQASIT